MKRIIRRDIKTDNSGFSLVELIIAVAILAFVIGPLLYSYIVSQQIANKSYTLGDATLISRNIVETIRADGVSSVVTRVDEDFSPFGGSSYIDPDYISDGFGVWSPAAGVYQFLVRDIPAGTLEVLRTAGNSTADMTFDAVVRIDASTYRNGLDMLNDQLISEYSPMDGMFLQERNPSADPDRLAILEFAKSLEMLGVSPSISESEVENKFNRTIVVDAKRETDEATGAFTGDVVVTVTYEYTFTYNYGGTIYNFEYDVEYFDIYWDTYDPAYPITLYIYYRPYYGTPGPGGTQPDTIEILNLDRLDLTVFVIKQLPLDMLDPSSPDYPADPAAREGSYRALIRRVEHISLQSLSGSGRTKVYTNFRQNFAGNTPNPANFEQRVRYGTVFGGTVWVDPGSYTDELVAQEARDRIFSIHIDVFRNWSNGADPILSFDATHLE